MKRTLRIAVSPFMLSACAVAVHGRAFANYYANAGGRKDGGEHSFNQYLSHIISSEGGAETPTPAWIDTDSKTMTTVPTMQKGYTAIQITGDALRNKVKTMPGVGFYTVSINLLADWDTLMAVKGYPALKDFYLSSTPEGNTTSNVEKVNSESNAGKVLRTDYYDMQSIRSQQPGQGVYRRRDVYSNGQAQSRKQVHR